MTIMCPERFNEAVRKAIEVDEFVDVMAANETDADKKAELERKRGEACQSLLQCLASRAYSDALDNRTMHFRPDTDIVYPHGNRIRARLLRPDDCPVRETVIFDDIVQHSFFFREVYRDPRSHEIVEIFDHGWYIFPEGILQARADAVATEELPVLCRNQEGYHLTFDPEEADAARKDGRAVRTATLRRQGMCGGIIFHPHYREGKPDGTGSWSTHT